MRGIRVCYISHLGVCKKADSRVCKGYESHKTYYCKRMTWMKQNCAAMCGLCTPAGKN